MLTLMALHCLACTHHPPTLLPPCPAPVPPQDELHKRYKHGSALQMMCWMNFWCVLPVHLA